MDDKTKWEVLHREADRKAKEEMLEKLLNATGLGEYIAKAISDHERQNHGTDV